MLSLVSIFLCALSFLPSHLFLLNLSCAKYCLSLYPIPSCYLSHLLLLVLCSTAWVGGGCQNSRFFEADVGVATSYQFESFDIDEVVLADADEWAVMKKVVPPSQAWCELPLRGPLDHVAQGDIDKDLMAAPVAPCLPLAAAVSTGATAPVGALPSGHRADLLRPPTV